MGHFLTEDIGALMVVMVVVLTMLVTTIVVGCVIVRTKVAVEVEITVFVFPGCTSVIIRKLLIFEVMSTVAIFVIVERRVEVSVKVEAV
jgi:hypothetical protein